MTDSHLVARMRGFGTTIFTEMTALAVAHDAVNLGQGFPDQDAPRRVREAAREAIAAGHNQYAPGNGIPDLRRAIAEHQRRFHELDFDPGTEVTVTAGATEAMAAAVLALCEVGDEIIVFEPWYDAYAADIALAGGVRRSVTLRPPDFRLDPAELRAAVTPRTRALILNTPHNPTGKVFDAEELAAIARVCREYDLIAVTDEVYEHLVFDGAHVPLATLPGMRGRTITISSAAKTFSVTGWKIGWACAAPPLTEALRATKQWLSFTNGTPFQYAVAEALRSDDDYFEQLRADYARRRGLLLDGLAEVGVTPYPPAGTFFVTADITPLGERDGVAFCRRLPAEVGVAAVPVAGFYDDREVGAPLVRFAFCKTEPLLREGVDRLRHLGSGAG